MLQRRFANATQVSLCKIRALEVVYFLNSTNSSATKLCSNRFVPMHWSGANQPIHWFLGGKGLGIQQRTDVWVGSPKSCIGESCIQG